MWRYVYDINQNDLVLISLTKSSDYHDSSVDLFYPNQTLAYHTYWTFNHIFQFSAPLSGTYLLRLTNGADSSMNYTGSSSHSISGQLAPHELSGTVDAKSTIWHSIANVNQNDWVLISLTKSSNDYDSSVDLFYPNQTLAYHTYWTFNHIFQFIAPLSGTYLLRLTNGGDSSMNYNASSSHPFDDQTSATPTPAPTLTPTSTSTPSPTVAPTPTPTETPTSSPTATPTPTSSPTSTPTSSPIQSPSLIPSMSASTGDSVTFAAPSSYASDNSSSNFIWDFGDGTTTTTNEATTTHTFSEPGNFTVTLRVQGAVGERIIQTYGITVNPKANDLFEILKIVIPLLAASITAGVSLYIYRKNKKTHNKENLSPTLPPPAPPKQCRQ